MTRTVFCRKYKRELAGLEAPPFPGPKGEDIYERVSRQAWEEWQLHQTRLINERRLRLMDPSDRAFLQQEMEKFFNDENFAQAEGYRPSS
ncbi:MAG: oxidative damage protection protein [Pseudomonadota bacterium]|nr:oxidative damage protection protein [Pseudomonadota bacterium]